MRKKLTRLAPAIVLAICTFVVLKLSSQSRLSHGQGATKLQIINVQPNSVTVGRFEKFELTFDITGTVATHLDWPYDPDPPSGVPAGVGITVDGLFSPDDWTTVYTQPAFLYQPYTYTVYDGRDHLYPAGDPMWQIRFTPPSVDTWRYRIQATDASGTAFYPASGDTAFAVEPSDSPGFLHVSQTDPRYFEFQDGTPFIGVGHADGFSRWRIIQEATEKFSRFASQRVSFFRVWLSSYSIFGSAWWPWSSHHLDYEGYLPATSLTAEEAYADGDVAMKLYEDNPCMRQGFRYHIFVLPERVYRVKARIKAVDISGPAQAGKPYGFVIKLGGWLGQDCASPDAGTPVAPYVTDTDDTWQIITGTLATTTDQYFLDNLYLSLTNASGGIVYVDEVWLEEQIGPDSYGPNILPKPKVNVHTYFDTIRSWQWDQVLDEAAAQGVYLKLVVLEKNEWIFNRITPSGTMTTTASNNNFYAAPDTKVRWLHQAWWRYLTARWGYSTAVHSWELLNEGDPFNGNHYDQAQAFAQYIHEHDPNRHMVTTSNWHSFPVIEFWDNPDYPDLDYADLHAYISTGWGEYPIWGNAPPSPLEFEGDPAHVRGESGHSLRVPGSEWVHNATVSPGRLAIHGRGEWIIRYWMKAEGFGGSCPYDDPDTMAGPRLMWILDNGQPGARSNVVPPSDTGKNYRCSAPAGTYDWTQFDSAHTADGSEAPISARIIITDDLTHKLYVGAQNGYGNSGTAWIDDIEIVAPDGTVLAVNGSVELDSMHQDTALYTSAYSLLWGGKSPAGARMPLVRGEAGLDHPGGPQAELDDLAQDTEGVWLHNLIWGGINPGGMYELYWWTSNIRNHDLYYHYKPFRDFMDGIPLSNGHYEDAAATASDADLRAWGQIDPVNRRGHLWIQNRLHTWRNVVDSLSIPAIGGSILIPGLPDGAYCVEWWDTYAGTVLQTETVMANDGLPLLLPSPLTADVAVKLAPAGPADAPDFGPSAKSASRPAVQADSSITYTIQVVNSGLISDTTVTLTDSLPLGLSYVPNSLAVTGGATPVYANGTIYWSGILSPTPAITLTYVTTVTVTEPAALVNSAVINAGVWGIYTRTTTVIANGFSIYLPLIIR